MVLVEVWFSYTLQYDLTKQTSSPRFQLKIIKPVILCSNCGSSRLHICYCSNCLIEVNVILVPLLYGYKTSQFVLTSLCIDSLFPSCFLSFLHAFFISSTKPMTLYCNLPGPTPFSPNTSYFLQFHPIKMHYESSVSTHDNWRGQPLWLFFKSTQMPIFGA